MNSEATGRKRGSDAVKEEGDEPATKAPRLTDAFSPRKKKNADQKWRGDPSATYSDWKIEVVSTKMASNTYEEATEEESSTKESVSSDEPSVDSKEAVDANGNIEMEGLKESRGDKERANGFHMIDSKDAEESGDKEGSKEDLKEASSTKEGVNVDQPMIVSQEAVAANKNSDLEVLKEDESMADSKVSVDPNDKSDKDSLETEEDSLDKKEDEEEAEGEAVVETYHVHRFELACGKRKSDYFDSLFQNGDKFKEGETRTSRIELHLVCLLLCGFSKGNFGEVWSSAVGTSGMLC